MDQLHEPPSIDVQPDLELLGRVSALRRLFHAAASLIAATILLAWLFPALRIPLPAAWRQMQPDTAVAGLLLVLAKSGTEVRRRATVRWQGRAAALVTLVLAIDAWLRFAGGPALHAAGFLAVAPGDLPTPGMRPPTALFFGLYAASILLEGPGGKPRRRMLDMAATLLTLVFLTDVGAYVFRASRLFGDGSGAQVPPLVMACMALLLFGLMVRRSQDGYYAVFVGVDVGSRVARFALPFAVLTPFLIVALGEIINARGWLSGGTTSALVSSVTATILLLVVMLMARKINRLQQGLVRLTLIDELTRLYNRRGFSMLGEHMLFEARRHGRTLTLLYFDLDDLKQVNDTHGHAIGSRMIADFADLLRETFRSNDVTARLGGDEFAVAVLESDPRVPMKRLELAVAEFNERGGRPYRISYSVGDAATASPPGPETFSDLVARADAVMYERKKRKKALKAAQASA